MINYALVTPSAKTAQTRSPVAPTKKEAGGIRVPFYVFVIRGGISIFRQISVGISTKLTSMTGIGRHVLSEKRFHRIHSEKLAFLSTTPTMHIIKRSHGFKTHIARNLTLQGCQEFEVQFKLQVIGCVSWYSSVFSLNIVVFDMTCHDYIAFDTTWYELHYIQDHMLQARQF